VNPETAGGSTLDGLAMIPDQPIDKAVDDRLKFADYAGVFTAFFLDTSTPTPLTVAISGPWGSGKTSLALLVSERLQANENWRGRWFEPPLICWFNAWHHADAPNVGVALAAHVARVLAPERRVWLRILQPLPTIMLSPPRRWWRRIWQGLLGGFIAVVGLLTVIWTVPTLREKLGAIGVVWSQFSNPVALFAAASALVALVARAYKAGGTLGEYLETPQEIAAKGSIAEVRAHLGNLIRQALRQRAGGGGADRRLVIFVDDLERCPADKALGLSEIVTQLLDHPGTIVVMVADVAPLVEAATRRYQNLNAELLEGLSGQRYLDKLINMHFNLPPLSPASVERLFNDPSTKSAS
jgi:hypothetical protein